MSLLLLSALLLPACRSELSIDGRPPRDTDPGDTDRPTDTDTDTDTAPTDTAPDDTGADSRTCGDGVAGAPEECDGADDDACPGACSDDCACPSMPATGELVLHVIDVGQGDALLVVSPDGFAMLVDAGDDDHYTAVRDYLDARGVPALDHVAVSHFHADHMGAMAGLLRDHPEVRHAFDSGGRYDSTAFEDYTRRAGDRRQTVGPGDRIDLGPSMTVDVLHGHVGDVENENNNSVVLRLTYGEVTMLLGGDCEAPVCEGALEPGPIDVYKVHHHGSYNGSSGDLLGAMEPRSALISLGADNSYGHPAEETVTRLEAIGATVWRTDLEGDLVVRTDGVTWSVNGIVEGAP